MQDAIVERSMLSAIVESLLAREQREDPKDNDRADNGSDDLTQTATGLDAQHVEQPATHYTTDCTHDEVDDTALVSIATNSASNVTGKNADNDRIQKIHIQ